MQHRGTLLLFFVIFSLSVGSQTLSETDSLYNVYLTAKQDTTKYQALYAYADATFYTNTDSAYNTWIGLEKIASEKLKYLTQGSAEWKAWIILKANAINGQGFVFRRKGMIDEALKYYREAYEMYKYVNHSVGLSTSINNIGFIYHLRGETEPAIDAYIQSYNICKQIKDTNGMASSLNNISGIYLENGAHDKCLEGLLQALELNLASKRWHSIAQSYDNIGTAYYNMGQYDPALFYYFKTLAVIKDHHDYFEEAATNNHIGMVYEMRGTTSANPDTADLWLDSAYYFYMNAYNIYRKIDYKDGLSESLINLAYLFKAKGNFNKAIPYALEAMSIAEELGYLDLIAAYSRMLQSLYKSKGDFKNALLYFELRVAAEDSLRKSSDQGEVMKKAFQFDFNLKHFEDSLKEQEQKKLHEVELKKNEALVEANTWQMYGLAAGLFLVTGMIVVGIVAAVKKKKANKIISLQKEKVEHRKELVAEKNRDILDSISYAKRLQDAILPDWKKMTTSLHEPFLFYKPKDIVAGDFYFADKITENEELIYVAAADCTGHGVPGAMVSVVCCNALYRSVREFGLRETGEILDKVSELVEHTFAASESDVKDGMDISLLQINPKNGKIKWSGANNPLWIFRKTNDSSDYTLIEIKPDKQPVGKFENRRAFTTHQAQLEEKDFVCLFTDGYPDQFGGDAGKKLKYSGFRNILFQLAPKNEKIQYDELNNAFRRWKKEMEQVDDVCVMGFKYK